MADDTRSGGRPAFADGSGDGRTLPDGSGDGPAFADADGLPRPADPADLPDPPEDLTVALIAAVAEDGAIGRDGGMPWHYPADLQRFKETTMDHPVVMGRRTYESIVDRLGEPLPGRTSIVLTTRELDLPEGAVAADGVAAALDAARAALAERHPDADTVYVAGGGSVYAQFLPLADRLVLTEIHDRPGGDTYFPAVERDRWAAVEREDREAFAFVTYERRTDAG